MINNVRRDVLARLPLYFPLKFAQKSNTFLFFLVTYSLFSLLGRLCDTLNGLFPRDMSNYL